MEESGDEVKVLTPESIWTTFHAALSLLALTLVCVITYSVASVSLSRLLCRLLFIGV